MSLQVVEKKREDASLKLEKIRIICVLGMQYMQDTYDTSFSRLDSTDIADLFRDIADMVIETDKTLMELEEIMFKMKGEKIDEWI